MTFFNFLKKKEEFLNKKIINIPNLKFIFVIGWIKKIKKNLKINNLSNKLLVKKILG
jgi:hypothetical protein